MKYLKLYEDYKDIDALCKKYNIRNYTINNGLVDVVGDVNMSYYSFSTLPLKFNKVSGDFNINGNSLTSLEGCAKEIGGSFKCSFNKLTSLEGGPKSVNYHCDCYRNQLKNLNDMCNFNGNLNLSHNLLSTLEGCPVNINGHFNCIYNNLTSLNGCPKKISGDFDCRYNQLVDLEDCPIEVDGNFKLDYNPVYEIYELFNNKQSFIDSLDYNYFRGGNKINKMRLTQALAEFGLECPDNIEGYIWE